jgi:hypothetical protein
VEQIRSHQTWGRSKTLQYLIKWKGYPESDNTWENADQIHAPELIKLYHQAVTRQGLKAWRIQLGKKHPLIVTPLRLHAARLCSVTNSSSSAVTTVYSSLPNPTATPLLPLRQVISKQESTRNAPHQQTYHRSHDRPTIGLTGPISLLDPEPPNAL